MSLDYLRLFLSIFYLIASRLGLMIVGVNELKWLVIQARE